MNYYLSELFLNRILNSLSDKERLLYTSVCEMEDKIAEKCLTPEAFINQFTNYLPHKDLAEKFDLKLPELIKAVNEIDEKINRKLEEIYQKIQWIDCTKIAYKRMEDKPNTKLFYVNIPYN
ncbi:hypothetical protein [Gracilibacillus alcaliphilus]|uniref:hypothetical protein n=1 Tax=Gracilibacillus alcaliphilus TaxID=1401441 RepID=UPI00195DCB71|nr:hypothetical protein [Gracilibacillus alcaliphilus]MBM7675931.1 ribosomal protein S8 [Gracilibacillus alcaliphilus]